MSGTSSPNRGVPPPSNEDSGSAAAASAVKNVTFPDDTLALIVAMVTATPSLEVTKAVQELFGERVIEDWEALTVESVEEVKAAVLANQEWSKVLTGTRLKKFLAVIEYASLGGIMLTNTMSFTEMLEATRKRRTENMIYGGSLGATMGPSPITDSNATNDGTNGTNNMYFTPALSRVRANPVTTTDSTTSTSTTSNEKFGEVPKLPNFSGTDEDYEKWQRLVTLKLGMARLLPFILEEDYAAAHPHIAQSVFYGLNFALQGGFAANIVNELETIHKDHNPYKLWLAIQDYYQTKTTTRTGMMKHVSRLINLKLDGSITATKFLSEWKDCCLKLQDSRSTLINDQEWLLALLYSAIQDDDYINVADKISADDQLTVTDVLREIRQREANLLHRNNKVSGDALRSVRRASTSKNNQGTKSGKDNDANGRKLPFLPKSWIKGVPVNILKAVKKWRYEINTGNYDVEALDELCYLPPLDANQTGTKSNGPTGGKQSSKASDRRKARRAGKTNTHNENVNPQSEDMGSGSDSNESNKKPKPPTNKRIRLNYKTGKSTTRVGFVDPNA